jgi:hypothetical protein
VNLNAIKLGADDSKFAAHREGKGAPRFQAVGGGDAVGVSDCAAGSNHGGAGGVAKGNADFKIGGVVGQVFAVEPGPVEQPAIFVRNDKGIPIDQVHLIDRVAENIGAHEVGVGVGVVGGRK